MTLEKTESTYVPRMVDDELALRLQSSGAIVIEGPKACGKTETARQFAASEVLLDVDETARQLVDLNPALILEGPAPRLIDEWQTEPQIWNHIRRAIDDRRAPGQFILTGSASPADDITRHSGAGRIGRLRMRPMSSFELDVSSGEVSLQELLSGNFGAKTAIASKVDVTQWAQEIARGGWPGFRGHNELASLADIRDYIDEIRRVEIEHLDGRRRDPEKTARLIQSLARNVATYVSDATLAADAGSPDSPLSRNTVSDYLNALTRLMIIEDQRAWGPHLRSKAVLRTAPKRHFVDPSLAVAALGSSSDQLLRDPNTFGFLFESLVVRDLRVYAQASDAQVLQYRASNGLEVDCIIETRAGRWAAFEVKLGTKQIDEAAAALLRFCRHIDTAKCGEPAVLGIITAGAYGYMRPDGVLVLPLGALGP